MDSYLVNWSIHNNYSIFCTNRCFCYLSFDGISVKAQGDLLWNLGVDSSSSVGYLCSKKSYALREVCLASYESRCIYSRELNNSLLRMKEGVLVEGVDIQSL